MAVNKWKNGMADKLFHGTFIKQKVSQEKENEKTKEYNGSGEAFFYGEQEKKDQECEYQMRYAKTKPREDTEKQDLKPEETPQAAPKPYDDIPASQTIYIKLVLDRTISMSRLYPYVYSHLNRLIVNLDKKTQRLRQTGQVGLKWGITLITDDKPETVEFANGLFTSSISQVDDALKKVVFRGGNEDGYENVTGAIEQAIRDLSDETKGTGSRGIFVLTDSLPYEDEQERDFCYCAEHTELRFAYCYVYDFKYFLPNFNVVNGVGEADVTGFRSTEVGNLQSYLEGGNVMIQEMLRKILDQTSTNVEYL